MHINRHQPIHSYENIHFALIVNLRIISTKYQIFLHQYGFWQTIDGLQVQSLFEYIESHHYLGHRILCYMALLSFWSYHYTWYRIDAHTHIPCVVQRNWGEWNRIRSCFHCIYVRFVLNLQLQLLMVESIMIFSEHNPFSMLHSTRTKRIIHLILQTIGVSFVLIGTILLYIQRYELDHFSVSWHTIAGAATRIYHHYYYSLFVILFHFLSFLLHSFAS